MAKASAQPRRISALASILLLATCSITTAQGFEFWPGTRYDPEIPTFQSVLGHAPAERIVSHAELMRYFEALAQAAPDRVRVWEYARSWEGRELIYAAVGSPQNIARLERISEGMQALADPRKTTDEQASAWIDELPAIVWLAYGVHGNEISSPDAAALTAYHLLAARGDQTVERVLADAVVFIDPTQNPDGRDRFVDNFRRSEGIVVDTDRISAEHDEPWPGGRTNHYLFDLNRDWFALTQPETRGRIEILQKWYPLVFVDLHEMGGDSTYYFAPEAVPYNPHLAQDQRSSLELFGRNNAKWFDRYGFDYFTREIYDAFYPGYGASWPAYYGAVAMTYEQASARGLALLRTDGEILLFRDGVQRHFVTSVSTAETGAVNREKLLRDFWSYRKSAIVEGESGDVKTIVLPYRGDTSTVDKLAGVLTLQGVEVSRALEPIELCGQQPAGSYLISLAQPAKRFIRNMLDRNVPMEQSFLEEQEARRRRNLPDQIYDVTAWSLPLMWNLETVECNRQAPSGARLETAGPELIRPGRVEGTDASVAWLVPWGKAASSRLLAAALREGLIALSPDRSFTQGNRVYPAGTLVFKNDDNPPDLEQRLRRLAQETGAEVIAADTSWVEDGVNWGSRQVVKLRAPRIALAWDSPTSSYSAGQTRYVIERQIGYPVSVIRTSTLARSDLRRYQVLILPSGSASGYERVLGSGGIDRLRDWVRSGGTLIALEGAVQLLADDDVGLLSLERESLEAESNGGNGRSLLENEEDFLRALEPDSSMPDSVAGVLVKAIVDQEHWISAGLPDSLSVLVRGNAIYSPIKIDDGINAMYYAGPDDLLVSGYLWEENRKQLAFKPFVVVERQGRGNVIGLTADPNVRAYLDGLGVLFTNAIFRGSAHSSPITW